jgi:isocitrate/isopropylmalate dehydrogenase
MGAVMAHAITLIRSDGIGPETTREVAREYLEITDEERIADAMCAVL